MTMNLLTVDTTWVSDDTGVPPAAPSAIDNQPDALALTVVSKESQRKDLISVLDSPKFHAMRQMLVQRNTLWSIIMEQFHVPDSKGIGVCIVWRGKYREALHAFRLACNHYASSPLELARPMKFLTECFRSYHKGRANMDSNPARVAMFLQPLVALHRLSQQHVDFLVQMHAVGIQIEEMRPLSGSAVIMENSKTAAPKASVIRDFNFAQAARGRVLAFGPLDTEWLDEQPELVASPAAVVPKTDADGRCVNNLSACPKPADCDPDNIMTTSINDGPAYPDLIEPRGSTTGPLHAFNVMQFICYLVIFPFHFPAGDWVRALKTALVDLSSAYYRCAAHADATGMQSLRVMGEWFVALCMVFGKRRSGEIYPLITTAILELHQSMNPRNAEKSGTAHFHSSGHTDDFSLIEANAGDRLRESFCALIFAAKVNAGHDSPAANKLVKNGFYSDVHRFVGNIDDVRDLMYQWPRKKQLETAAIILSPAFDPSPPWYPTWQTMKAIGNFRWSARGIILPLSGLHKMIAQPGAEATKSTRTRAVALPGERQTDADAKIAQDIHVLRAGMRLIVDNPQIGKVSMLSCLSWEHRMLLPGQCFKTVSLFGDTSFWGFAFGIEFLLDGVLTRIAMQLQHTPEFRAMLVLCAEGLNDAWTVDNPPECINVGELGWIAMAEEEFEEYVVAALILSFPDNKNCTYWLAKGYARQVVAQALLLRMTKRRWLTESSHLSTHLPRDNNQLFDLLSKNDMPGWGCMNSQLDTPFELRPVTSVSLKIQEFMVTALKANHPCAIEYDEMLGEVRPKTAPAAHCLVPEAIMSNEHDWRHRISMAARVHPDPLFIFNSELVDAAYRNQLYAERQRTGSCNISQTFEDLRALNRDGNRSKFTWTDGFHGGGGSSMSIIAAGMHVTQGWDNRPSAISNWQRLTGCVSSGNINNINTSRLQHTNGAHFSTMCSRHSSAMRHTNETVLGIDHPDGLVFTTMFTMAKQCDADYVAFEQVGNVMHTKAYDLMVADALESGYVAPMVELAPMAHFLAEDGRTRLIGFSHKTHIHLPRPFTFPDRMSVLAAERRTVSELMLCSTLVAHRFFCFKPIALTDYVFARDRINVVGTVGPSSLEDQVQHPHGMIGTQLSSGNTRLVWFVYLRALCSIGCAFRLWARAPVGVGGRRCRWLTPEEDLAIQDFPDGYPIGSDRDTYSMVNAAVNVTYYTAFMQKVQAVMAEMETVPGKASPPGAYVTKLHPDHPDSMPTAPSQKLFDTARFTGSQFAEVPKVPRTASHCTATSWPAFVPGLWTIHEDGIIDPSCLPVESGTGMYMQAGAPKFTALTYPKDRHQLANTPYSQFEIDLMDETNTRLIDNGLKSKVVIGPVVKQWQSHCTRTKTPPVRDPMDSPRTVAKFKQTAREWALIELGPRGIRGDSTARKFWAVTKWHETLTKPDPFKDDYRLQLLLSRAKKHDPVSVGKMPCTPHLLDAMDTTLALDTIEGFTVSAYHLNGLAYGNRVSEIAIGEDHTSTWKDFRLLLDDTVLDVTVSNLQPDELEETQQSDKTTRFGEGMPRSHFVNEDDQWRCIVTRMCELKRWLAKLGMAKDTDPVFSWAPGKGVTRTMSQKLLKRAAMLCGIPAGDVGTHSLRSGAMCQAMAAEIPWHQAKQFLRWKSDKSAELYNWPSSSSMKGRAAAFFKSASLHAVRRINGMGVRPRQ